MVIQGLGVNRKSICDFLLMDYVINNGNFGLDVSPTIFEILTFIARKWLLFLTFPLFDALAQWEPLRISG